MVLPLSSLTGDDLFGEPFIQFDNHALWDRRSVGVAHAVGETRLACTLPQHAHMSIAVCLQALMLNCGSNTYLSTGIAQAPPL